MSKTKNDRRFDTGPSRRRVIKTAGLGVGLAVSAPMILTPRKARAATRIVIRDAGGPYVEGFGEAFYKPFNEKFAGKIEAVGVAAAHEPTAQIKAMVDNGTYTWDMADMPSAGINLLSAENYLEPIELDDDPVIQEIPESLRGKYGVGDLVYATVLAYRTDVYPAKAPAPTGGWKDLWDIEGIPGRRALRKSPEDTFEEAVMADGAKLSEVYPIDTDRAFASLNRIKPHVHVWWTGGAQTSQMLANGEVDMTPTWNGRAQAAIDGGAPAAISWAQSLYSLSSWCILRGGPNVDACREFIRFASQAERQAAWTPYIAYGPTNPGAYKYIDSARAKLLPTNPAYFDEMLKIDYAWWSANKEEAQLKFTEWMLA